MGPVYLSVFFFVSGESALHVLVSPYLTREFGLGPAAIGVIVGVFGFASLLARLPAGAAYSPARSRRLLFMGGGVCCVAFLLVPLAAGPVPFAVLMALDGFGWSVATTTQLAALVAGRPAGMPLAAAMGWYSGFTGLGNTAGGTLGGLGGDLLGFHASFLALAAIVALGTVVMTRALRRAAGGRLPAPARRRPPGVARRRARGRLTETRRALVGLPIAVWSGFLVMVFINFINGVHNTFQPVLALGAGLTLTQIGVLSSCRSWASSVVRLGSGSLFARVDTKHLTTPLVLLGIASLFLLPPLRSSFAWQVPLFLMVGLSRGLLRVTGSVQVFDAVGGDERRHGFAAALIHAGLDVGKLAGPLVAGVLAQVFGLITMFQVLPALLLAPYAALLLAARRSGTRAPATAAGGGGS
jgi:predicted MFS family arabinose efflux permease